MPAITVNTPGPATGDARQLLDEIDQIQEAIRREAHGLAEQLQSGLPSNLDNWLAAERRILYVPACELLENGRRYLLRAALPGLRPEQIRVTALPGALILKVEARENTEKEADEVLLSEFSRARVLRRFELANAIDVDKVQARFRDGMLDVAAPKLGLKTRRDKVALSLPKPAAPKKRRAAKGRGQ